MIIKQLIEELKQYPEQLQVFTYTLNGDLEDNVVVRYNAEDEDNNRVVVY